MGPIILLRFEKAQLRRVRRKTRYGGDDEGSWVGNEVAYVEEGRNAPVGRNGNVVRVGVDLPTDTEGTGGARVVFARLLYRVTFGA